MNRIDAIASKLDADWIERAPYERLSGEFAVAGIDEAYAVQRALQGLMAAHRGPIAGRKIALTSKAMQEMVGHDSPVAGAIFAGDVHLSPAEIRRSSFRRLGLEYELAFELGADAVPRDTPFGAAEALALVAGVRPAFELIEDKEADYSDLCPLTLTADNAWCGGIVLGDPVDGWQSLDVANLPATLHQDGVEPEPANTGAANPVASLAWVLNHFTGAGERIRAGEHVITGSVLRTRFPMPGDHLRYEIDGRASVEITII
jgi:2-keto-4-pentenoate hydratase